MGITRAGGGGGDPGALFTEAGQIIYASAPGTADVVQAHVANGWARLDSAAKVPAKQFGFERLQVPLLQHQLQNQETFIMDPGEEDARAICYDGSHIWAVTYTWPAKVIKLNPADGSHVTYPLTEGLDNNAGWAICYDGTYIWIGLLQSTPGKLVRMNPSDGSYTIFEHGGTNISCNSICYDGSHIWAALYSWPTQVVKMDPSDGTYVTYTMSLADERYARGICYSGSHIWIANWCPPARIIKMDPADGSYVAYVLDLAKNERMARCICYDGVYIWIGLDNEPGLVVKMDPKDGSYVTYQLPSPGEHVSGICFDGRYIWGSLEYDTPMIFKMDPSDGSCALATVAGEDGDPQDICFDGSHIWVALRAWQEARFRRITQVGGPSMHHWYLQFGCLGAITPGGTSYLVPGNGPTHLNEITRRIQRACTLQYLYIKQRVASGTAGFTDIYTVRVNGADTALTCTLDNATEGEDAIHQVQVYAGDEVSISLVSNNGGDTSADVVATVEVA